MNIAQLFNLYQCSWHHHQVHAGLSVMGGEPEIIKDIRSMR